MVLDLYKNNLVTVLRNHLLCLLSIEKLFFMPYSYQSKSNKLVRQWINLPTLEDDPPPDENYNQAN